LSIDAVEQTFGFEAPQMFLEIERRARCRGYGLGCALVEHRGYLFF
jgi:4-hydroxyphenylpyruvate dioxygenase-like putative hemolysin